jgi:hypothetical protein
MALLAQGSVSTSAVRADIRGAAEMCMFDPEQTFTDPVMLFQNAITPVSVRD